MLNLQQAVAKVLIAASSNNTTLREAPTSLRHGRENREEIPLLFVSRRILSFMTGFKMEVGYWFEGRYRLFKELVLTFSFDTG